MEKNEIYLYIHIHNYINKSLRCVSAWTASFMLVRVNACAFIFVCLFMYARVHAHMRGSQTRTRFFKALALFRACVDDIVHTLPWPNTTALQPHRAILLQPKAELCKL